MKRFFLLALMLPSLAGLLLALPAQEVQPRASLEGLTAGIQTELQSHGDRVLGPEIYRWSTRLEGIAGCRAELSVRLTSNYGAATVRTESVKFSLGALEPYRIDLKKNWLELPCAGREKCIFSTSTCAQKSEGGVVIDCATASQKHAESFSLQIDGDAAAASRLEQAFRQAVTLCREPESVSF